MSTIFIKDNWIKRRNGYNKSLRRDVTKDYKGVCIIEQNEKYLVCHSSPHH
jgi:hypothetical protein